MKSDPEGHGFNRAMKSDPEGHGFNRAMKSDPEGHGFNRAIKTTASQTLPLCRRPERSRRRSD